MRFANIHQMYDCHTFLILRMVLSESSSCVDVGCHVGQVLREILTVAPKGHHYAFEPIPGLCENLRSNPSFRSVDISDLALSDEAGTATFFWVKNDPAYSGLKQRRYDRPDPEIVEINVRKARLDDVIERTQSIDFIKIDVEGGELPVLRGARRVIGDNKPFIVFESGTGASDRYGTNGVVLYDYLVRECGLELNTLDGFLTGQGALSCDSLEKIFNSTERYYFIAHRPLSDAERMRFLRWYALDLDSRLFTLSQTVQRLDQTIHRVEQSLPSEEIDEWGATETQKGQSVNRQADGSSAIWVHFKHAWHSHESHFYFGEHRVRFRATVAGNLVTSHIPESVIQNVGDYPVRIVDSCGRTIHVGTFKVKG
jgi:FkbM family methyltransferase